MTHKTQNIHNDIIIKISLKFRKDLQMKETEKLQKIDKEEESKHNSKIKKIARKFSGFLKKNFPSRWWSMKKDDKKGPKF